MTVSKVLCVDDSQTELAHIQSIVTSAGCSVVSASSASEAIAKAKSERPDLIFMDVVMGDSSGFDACRDITSDAETKHIPVVFTTSKNQKADQVWAELQGGKALIGKPYSDDEILNQIKKYS